MTVTRTARLTGAALCAALALVGFVWLLCDLAAFGPTTELLWYWAGDHGFRTHRTAGTTFVDPLLLVAYAVTAFAALRSPLAAPALAVTGLTTLALRLPGLWASGIDALVTTLITLALAAGLVVTAAAGRHDDRDHAGSGGRGRSGGDEARDEPYGPERPRTGPAVAAGILCALAGLVRAAWELRWATLLPAEYTVGRYTGERSLMLPTLAVPPGWLNAVLVLLLLAAAGSAFARARHTRPLGLLAGLLLTGAGAAGTAAALRPERHTYLPAPDLYAVAYDAGCFYALAAGLAVLLLLGPPGRRRRVPYRPAAARPPAPPHRRPPSW
ncbi:hypothetical protein [Streptomyces roseicoloratus]|uniref:hypothetical protein n=1 Tax=Streptomyces roseicoloratus TaxID=2508722 RepID=UPI001009CED5|nr:hypothetical protein [Streptomyces roseicoloratus]